MIELNLTHMELADFAYITYVNNDGLISYEIVKDRYSNLIGIYSNQKEFNAVMDYREKLKEMRDEKGSL